jgi:hypothetical protein
MTYREHGQILGDEAKLCHNQYIQEIIKNPGMTHPSEAYIEFGKAQDKFFSFCLFMIGSPKGFEEEIIIVN